MKINEMKQILKEMTRESDKIIDSFFDILLANRDVNHINDLALSWDLLSNGTKALIAKEAVSEYHVARFVGLMEGINNKLKSDELLKKELDEQEYELYDDMMNSLFDLAGELSEREELTEKEYIFLSAFDEWVETVVKNDEEDTENDSEA